MNIIHIINLTNYILDKEWSGRVVTPSQFNDIIPFANEELFTEEFTRLKGLSIQAGELDTGEIISLLDDSLLSRFKKVHSAVGAGAIALPDDYKKKLSAKIEYSEKPIIIRHLEWVSDYEMQRRAAILTRKDPYQYPYGLIREPTLVWVPSNTATIYLVYLRQPATPFIDWVVDADGKVKLLEVGWYVENKSGILYVKNTDGVIQYTDVTYRIDVTIGTAAPPATIDPEYEQMYYVNFVNRILEKAGLRIENDRVVQYAEMQQKKGE